MLKPTTPARRVFGLARPAEPEPPLSETVRLRLRLQQKIDRYEREALRLALRGRTEPAEQLARAADRLRLLCKTA